MSPLTHNLPRGVSASTAAHFEILPGQDDDLGAFWAYPVIDADSSNAGTRRHFRTPKLQKPPCLFAWADDALNPAALYNAPDVEAALQEDGEVVVWICAQESDVWLLHERGIPGVCAFSLDGIEAGVAWLRGKGVTHARFVPTATGSERRIAAAWWSAGKSAHLALSVGAYILPGTKGLSEFLQECDAADLPLNAALRDLPLATLAQLGQWARAGEKASREKGLPKTKPSAMQSVTTAKGTPKVRINTETLAQIFVEDVLLAPALEMELSHSDTDEEFISVLWKGKRETYFLSSAKATHLMDEIYSTEIGVLAPKEVLERARLKLEGIAERMGEEKKVSPRLQERAGRVYLDLANPALEVVEIGDDIAGGWRIITDAPVVFRRAAGTQPLPRPVKNEDNAVVWAQFRELFAPGSQANWVLMVGWLFSCFRPPLQPYAGLCVTGEQDSGKTERSMMLRSLIDPNKLALADTPDTPRDLAIMAQNRFILGFDNLSGVAKWLSNALCRIATHGNFSTRKLHTDGEEKIFDAMRPLLLNGIDTVLGRHDLQRRLIFVHIPRFESGQKRSVRELRETFDKLRPALLGAIMDAVSVALRNFPDTPLPDVGGGMLDFAQWICAGEEELPWDGGEFVSAYIASRKETQRVSLDEPFPLAIEAWMRRQTALPLALGARGFYRSVCNVAAEMACEGEEYEAAELTGRMIMRERALAEMKKSGGMPSSEVHFGRWLKERMDALRVMGIECQYRAGQHDPWVMSWVPGPDTNPGALPEDTHLFHGLDDDVFGE